MATKHSFLLIFLTLFLLVSTAHAFTQERYEYPNLKNTHEDAASDEFEKITLQDAIQIALKKNPLIRAVNADITRKKAQLTKATSAFMPEVDVYTSYSFGDAPSSYLITSIDQRKFESDTDFNDPGNFENFETGITGKMTLFNGGRNYLNSKIATEFLSASESKRKSTINVITAGVITAWFNTISSEEFISIARESVETVNTQLEIMTVRFKGGSALKSDILSLKVRLAEVEEELLKSENRYHHAKAALASILGMPPEKELILEKTDVHFKEAIKNLEAGIKTALGSRPEMNQSKSMLKKAGMGLDVAKSDYIPSVHLSGKYYFDDPDMNYDKDRQNWAVGIMVNWNIFSGFSSDAGRKESVADMEAALAADRKTELEVKLDVTNAWLNFEETSARLKVARKSVDMAVESLALVRKQYEGGSATITRYLEAELARNKAKTRSAKAYYDHMNATAETARAIGMLVVPENFVNPDPPMEQ